MHAATRRFTAVLTALAAALVVVLGPGPGVPVASAAVTHATLVRPTPTANTPHVTNGDVRTVAEVGGTVVLGGNFTTSTDPDGTVVNRSYVLAFDKATGRIRRDWAPVLDGEVFSVVAAPDGQSVYVGGRFNRVNGASQLKVARLRISDGTALPFQAGYDAVVTTMALQGDRLFVGGVFNNVQGRARRVVAVNAQTGVVDDTMALSFAGKHNGGDGKIWRIEASPDGRNVVVVGSFTSVDGQPRNQIAKLATGASVTLSTWSTPAFSGNCANFTDYVRDVSYAPDSSYFVVVTTGAKGSGLNGTCDSVTRWEDTTTANASSSWIEYSGGDSYYSVEVTGPAVYVGGHFRWSNNSYGADSLGAGGIATTGIASLDPVNGLPLSWNPGRDRGRAVWQLVATPDGLYVASDTDRIAGGIYRGRIAFFPTSGGKPVPQPAPLTLPATIDQFVPAAGGTAARVTQRSFDGTTAGPPTTSVADASALAGVGAAFWADGTLYTAQSNGTLQARSFDGTTLGAATAVDLQRLTAFASDLSNMRSALYDRGRLYYTLSNSSTLYMRYFSVENRVVGAQRFDVAGSSGGLSYSNVTGMVKAGDAVYFADLGSGALRQGTWRTTGGIDPATITTVSPADAGGLSWTSTELWGRPSAPMNIPPVARTTATCTGLRCTFDASTSTDPDGTIASVAWTFSGGGTASGTAVTQTFAAPGTYTATATVTDDAGATNAVNRNVTVVDATPVARFTSSCDGATCSFDASTSTDADGTIASYAWTFGDGSTGTGATATRAYTASGSYTVTLTATDDRGQTGTVSRSIPVTVPATQAAFVGATQRAGTTAATQTGTVPAAARTGDQLVLFVSTNGTSASTVNTPAGWTRVLDPVTSGSRHAVFARTATATDPGATVSFTLSGAARADVVVAAYRGLALAPSGATFAAGYTTPTAAAAAGDWVVSYWADKSATTAAWGAPAGVVTRVSFAGTGAGHVSELLADSGSGVAAGTVGGLQATVSAPVANAIAATLVLRPTP